MTQAPASGIKHSKSTLDQIYPIDIAGMRNHKEVINVFCEELGNRILYPPREEELDEVVKPGQVTAEEMEKLKKKQTKVVDTQLNEKEAKQILKSELKKGNK